MKKLKEWFEDTVWLIGAYIRQPIVPTKTIDWVIANDCSWSSMSNNRKWDYYWFGDFKTGYQVKVRREVAN